MHDKKIEKAQINWARRIENYIVLIRNDKFKDKDVANLLDDINLSNKPYINDDRIKRYCVTKKGYLLKVLNSSYKSQECIARNLDCFASQISFYPSEERGNLGNGTYLYALWTDDLTMPEIIESDADKEVEDDIEEEYDSFDNEEIEDETEEDYDRFFLNEEVEDETDEKSENSFEDEDYL